MPKLKVLHITKWFPNSTDEQLGIFVEKHVRAVQAHADVHVFHLFPSEVDSATISYKEIDGMPTTTLSYPSESSALYKLCTMSLEIKKAVKGICEQLGEPDLIHGHIYAQPAVIARKYFSKTPLIMTEHWTGFVNGYFDSYPSWKKALFRKSSQWACCTTVPSPFLASAMRDSHGFNGKFEVVGNVIESLPKEAGRETAVKHFLTVADLHDHNKNISGSLKAFSNLQEDFLFQIIGDGEDADDLKALTQSLGLETKVKFLGRMKNQQVLEYISKSDFLLVNSRYETFSMITAEALASGVPVIATRCGGPEQFVDDTNGILIDKDSPEQLGQALRKANSGNLVFNSNQIRTQFQNRFSAEAIGARFYELYLMAINQRSNT